MRVLVVVALVAAIFTASCGTSPCGLKLVQHLFLPPPEIVLGVPQQRDISVPCCGGSVYRDVDLTTAGEVELDLNNPNPAASQVDGFLTSAGCDKLFGGPYSGTLTSPLCTVYIGPVAPRAVSARTKIAPGRYRLFAQAYASNESAHSISLDLGIWTTSCRWNPIGP